MFIEEIAYQFPSMMIVAEISYPFPMLECLSAKFLDDMQCIVMGRA